MYVQDKTIREHNEGLTLFDTGSDSMVGGTHTSESVWEEFYTVECCIRGRGRVVINGREFLFKEGDCICLFPGDAIEHVCGEGDELARLWCTVDGLSIGKTLRSAGITSVQPYAPSEAYKGICAVIKELINTKNACDMGAQFRRTAHVYELFGIMLRNKSISNENEWVERAVEYIEAHYKDNINVVDMAKSVGLERSYFSTLFKSRTGTSPYDYLTQFRIKRACALMKGTEYSIAKIADNTGFDPQNFARIFKREVGVSPRKYRATVVTQGTESKIN